MTTPVQAPAQPKADPAAALWRAVCTLATTLDARIIAEEDPGAVINVVLCHGGDPADLEAMRGYAMAQTGKE